MLAVARRDDVITEAIALLRQSGPDSLTSVNVAGRLGVTQSAIYRHIRDMDELTTVASNALIAELGSVMVAAVAAPETTWGDGTHITRFAERLAALINEHQQTFVVLDRWRYDDGALGDGIRALLEMGAELIAGELEVACRIDFPVEAPFDASTKAAQLAHSRLIIDDVLAVARLVTAAAPDEHDDTTALLALRLFAGWCAYSLDMTHRLGVPTPVLGGPALSAPRRPAR